MIAVIDYGVGNLYSLTSSLNYLKIENTVTSDISVIRKADKIILPGVGAFSEAKEKLENKNLDKIIIEEVSNGKTLLGICLGMQLLFEKSYEYGISKGLSLIEGEICPLEKELDKTYKVPHMGWNSLEIKKKSKLYKYISNGDYVYYVHSYYAKNCEKNITATSFYGIDVTGSVENKNVYGTQFHPEKSGKVGLKILQAFNEI